MNRLLYIALYSSLLLAFTACTSDDAVQENKYTVGEADNEIRFSAGVTTGGQSAQSRADATPLAGHYAMKEGTQIRLKVDGTWTGHDPVAISQTTECTTNQDAQNDGTSEYASTAADNINALTFAAGKALYWDDYGTGDPNNSANRANGLNVFGVAVDGEDTAPTISGSDTWTSLSWEVNTDGSNVLKKDIICSNNLSDKVEPSCRYTFANRNNDEKRRLDFKHVLSKITFEVTAGTGFTATNGFTSEPTIHLTNNTEWKSELSGYTENNYCLYTGKVDIEGAKATADASSKAIKMEKIDYASKKYTYHALVYPGTPLGGTDNTTIIALINADGNVYKVHAAEIRTKMAAITEHDNYKTLAGHNYIIKVTINKQGLNVTAAVTNWNTVTADAEAKINITTGDYGDNGDNSLSGFDLYLKKTTSNKYEMHGSVTKTGGNYVTGLYWPTTTNQYHLRALLDPVTGSPSLMTDGNYTLFDSSDDYAVSLDRGAANNDYQWGTTWDGTEGAEHYGADITPTAGNVRLQFKHVMSQVKVIVATTTGDDKVDLTNSKCVIEKLHNSAKLNMHEGTVGSLTGAVDYTVYDLLSASPETVPQAQYTSIQIPQEAFTADDGIKFVITLKDGTKYELPLSNLTSITKWESGGSYTYTLTLKKQGINVTAQIKEWNELGTASGDIQL